MVDAVPSPAPTDPEPGSLRPRVVLRLEAGLVAASLLGAAWLLVPDLWWVLFAAFLLFDLSALGYLRGPRVGAACYNAGHSYVGPLLLGAAVVVAARAGAFESLEVIGTTASLAWAFHVAVDRALGFGLKESDAFQHTHLGWIGGRSEAGGRPRPAR